ncbi:glycosyltransferase family 4 protein [Candidatus Uhrbacteria bacterium]|nr:glycosyltransferase family 4 protein [Candidatus Uhrbacteria bacterium]
MVVGQVVCIYPPRRGGIGTVAAEYTRRLESRGVDVRVFEPSNLRPWFTWGNAAFVPSLFWKLRDVDVIHLHYPFYGGEVFAWLASIVWRKPLVVTYHMQPIARGWLGMVFRLHRLFLQPVILRRARRIFCSSREYANGNGLPNGNRLSILPFGVDTERFHVGRDDAFRAAHGIPTDATAIIFVGGLDAAHDFKGVDVLLDACATLDDPSWQLLVVGSGDRKAAFEAHADRLGIAARVHFAGSVPFDDLPRAYRAADIHVLPSVNRGEAFGLVTLEAAATGIPSVVSDLPGMRSLVIPGETGLHAQPGDPDRLAAALTELLQQDGRREVMGAAARTRAEREYAIDAQIDRLMKEYENRHHH